MSGETSVHPAATFLEGTVDPHPQKRRRTTRWLRRVVLGTTVIGLALGAAFWVSRSGKGDSRDHSARAARESVASKQVPGVGVVNPVKGGMARTTTMPGTIRGFDVAPLYSMVPGYVRELKVDRGDRVKQGQTLVLIENPEIEVGVIQAKANLDHSNALVKESEAKVKAAQAGVQAAEAAKREAHSNLEKSVAQRTYRSKALERITNLARRNAIEPRLVDEEQDEYEASLAAEHSSQAGIETAEARLEEAKAAVELARADLITAKAQVSISQANLQKAEVMQRFTQIQAPFDGVITYRGEQIHPGAFIRAATEGMADSLLTVARTDLMRTIVPVADPDVPFCNVGDPATVRIDALAGRVFKGKISRMAEAEDLKARTMRVEIDLPNPDGVLRDGMFGRAVIQLEPPSEHLAIPASALVEHGHQGEGAVYLVRDGQVHRAGIKLGRDNGLHVEVLSGLSPADQVILQPSSSLREGAEVSPEVVKRSESGESGG